MSNKMLDAALAYAAQGWPIFSCRIDKSPYTKHGVNDATTDPERIKEMWKRHPKANIGLNAGEAGFLIIDLDPGHSMKELEKNVGQIPATKLITTTPRGGRHLYLTLGEGELVACSVERLATNVDVRSFHGYVLLPPSVTKDGTYEWECEGEPAYRTDEIVRVANSAREKHKDRDTWLIDADLTENIEDCTRWLLNQIPSSPCKVAIEGHQGDQCAYDTAAMCKSYGISQAMAFELMWEHWNPRCIPPWRDDEVEHFERKIENGYKYNTSPPGNVTAAYKTAKATELFTKVTVSGGEWSSANKRLRIIDRPNVNTITPPPWLIKDFLPEGGYTLMFGAPSTYKTFLALDIALSIAAGFMERPTWSDVAQCGKVLFVVGEGRGSLVKRVRAWEQVHFHGNQVHNFYLGDPVPNVTDDPDQFLSLLKRVDLDTGGNGFKLVVLDTVGRAMQGVNENTQEHASSFTRMVEGIQLTTGGAVLALHHTGKGDGTSARGSSVFRADADTEIMVQSQGMLVQLTMTKQKDAPEWKRPEVLKLVEAQLDMDGLKSLVVVQPSPEDKITTGAEAAAMLDIIEAEGLAILERDTMMAYSQRQFADQIALAETVTLGGDIIRAKYLTVLREDNSRAIARCFIVSGLKTSWRWQT